MKFFQQTNPAWGLVKLGDTPFTIARYGCLISCISMYLSYLGHEKTPKELAKMLDFTKEGMLIWSSINRVGLCLKKRISTNNIASFKKDIMEGVRTKSSCSILQINNSHWVLCSTSRVDYPNDYMVIDPMDGRVKNTNSYTRLGGRITGFAVLDIK